MEVTYNLLSNALKFTPAVGSVQIECEIADNYALMLQVADTGIGIPQDQLPRIFDRFHQVDSSSTRAYSGTGIGLSLVKELTDWLGGTTNPQHNWPIHHTTKKNGFWIGCEALSSTT